MNNEALQARVLETLEAQGHLLASLVQAVSGQQPQIDPLPGQVTKRRAQNQADRRLADLWCPLQMAMAKARCGCMHVVSPSSRAAAGCLVPP